MQKNEVESLAYTILQKLKPIKDLNIKPQSMKILEENRIQSIQNNPIHDIGFGSDFLVWHQKHRQQNQKYTSGSRSNLKTSVH